ncbi:MAG: NAD(P)H-dependent oxidoreductase subunit E [Bacteroidetes bacterium]|nr:NAD(P)H-dependent oxidoreductase subunit E [Bacteroidota bacterium]
MGRTIREILENQPNLSRDRLIPILQEIQDEVGYLSEEAILLTAEFLKLPTSKLYGVATYYDQFRFEPRGRYHIRICRGTACHVEGSLNLLNELEKILKIKPGQTTRDGLFSLDIVRCIGACGLAPVMDVNKEYFTGFSIQDVGQILKTYRERELL